MLRNCVFFSCFLLCFVSGADHKDLINGLNLKNSEYSLVKPQVVHRWVRDSNRQSQSKESEEEMVSYAINIADRKHFLHLQKNRDFLHPDLDINSNHKSTHPEHHDHCYYHGEVEGYENSLVAMSTCSGLRGVIIFGNETYGLEPIPDSAANEHLLYQLRDTNPENITCGVVNEATAAQSRQSFEPGQSLASLLRRKRNLPQTRYVELALVADNLRYNYKKQNETAVRHEMVEMANLLDGYYKMLNIRVVLVGLEIFTDGNPFSVDSSPGEVLSGFVKWRKSTLLPKVRHDVGQLIIGRPQSYDGVLGMAFVGTVCSVSSSGGINVFGDDRLLYASTIVAHEMGHNLGMSHDTEGCSCDSKTCIMAPSASSQSTSFSRCSAEDFETLIFRGGGVCLKNQPSQSDVVGAAKCGNGVMERGEECDCGTPEECKTKCCDAATCKLTTGSACAEGSCCHNCQLKVAGTPCRGSVNSCDLPEYCNGQNASCPEDFYIMDGLPCENGAAYCYEGRCQTYDYQCKHLFAPEPAQKAADECFLFANVQGGKFGNCGITSRGEYIKCSVANAMCGKVQCTNVDVNNPPSGAHVSIQMVNGSKCVNADFNLGTDVLDPAYVNPGSPCDKGKTCLDFKCVDASALKTNLDCDAQTTCNGHGVCNDQGHCHCQNSWAPPRCDRSGPGGSVDSGPAQIDYSLRNGLLIFFLLVVPLLVLLILVLLFVFRKDTLDSCLKGGRRRRSGNTQQGNGQSSGNVHAHTTTQLPTNIPQVVEYPPATSAPVSGVRYGELDYWSTEATTAPSRPPPPKQGPGVPKPIPPRQLPA